MHSEREISGWLPGYAEMEVLFVLCVKSVEKREIEISEALENLWNARNNNNNIGCSIPNREINLPMIRLDQYPVT